MHVNSSGWLIQLGSDYYWFGPCEGERDIIHIQTYITSEWKIVTSAKTVDMAQLGIRKQYNTREGTDT